MVVGFYDNQFKIDNFETVGNTLLFNSFFNNKSSLWRTDGSIAGTEEITIPGESVFTGGKFKRIGNEIYFAGNTLSTGNELWKTDGTGAGTQLLSDITPGTASSNISSIIDFNGSVLFYITNGSNAGIWSSDGSPAGTQRISSINISSGVAVGNSIFFSVYNSISWHYELHIWNSITNNSSLVMVMPDSFIAPSQLQEFNGLLYFILLPIKAV